MTIELSYDVSVWIALPIGKSKEFNEKEISVDKVSKSSRFSAFAHLDIPGRICLHHR